MIPLFFSLFPLPGSRTEPLVENKTGMEKDLKTGEAVVVSKTYDFVLC